MPFEFHLPDIGEGIAEAEIVRWLVAEGDEVTEDQPIAEVETDKAVVEMPAPVSGTVLRLGAEEGSMLRVGELMVVVDDGSPSDEAEAPAPAPSAQAEMAEPAPAGPQSDAPPATAPESPPNATDTGTKGRRAKATPATRRLARELGVDLTALAGSGPGGRITDDDVAAAANGERPAADAGRAVTARPVPSPGVEEERIPLRGLRRRTAETMTNAWRDIPHTVGFHEVDAQALLDLRRALKDRAERAGVPLTLTALLVKATALALVEHPMANSSFDAQAGEIVLKHRRNIGVAVETGEGLVLPIVRDADRVSLLGIARELARLTAAARDRSIDLADLQGGTFTITNYGPLGGYLGTSIIKPPEAGILGFGAVREQAVVRDGEIVARPILPMSFASDHRIVDGDLSIGFCTTVRRLLENPAELLLEEG